MKRIMSPVCKLSGVVIAFTWSQILDLFVVAEAIRKSSYHPGHLRTSPKAIEPAVLDSSVEDKGKPSPNPSSTSFAPNSRTSSGLLSSTFTSPRPHSSLARLTFDNCRVAFDGRPIRWIRATISSLGCLSTTRRTVCGWIAMFGATGEFLKKKGANFSGRQMVVGIMFKGPMRLKTPVRLFLSGISKIRNDSGIPQIYPTKATW